MENQTKTIWIFSISILITAMIVGGAVYFGQQKIVSQYEKDNIDAQAKIKDLESQLEQIQSAISGEQNKNVLQIPDVKDWKVYADKKNNVEISYPDNVFKTSEEANELYHELANFKLKSEADGSDVGLARDIVISFDQNVDQDCKYFEENMKSDSKDFSFENVRGTKYDTGAEGRGVVNYCIKDNDGKDILLVRRFYINESYSTEIQKESDYINSKAQEQLFDLMLKTIKIKDYDISNLNYENQKYKFSLKFPESWKGYKAKEDESEKENIGKIDTINFALSDNSLFDISIFTKDEWKNMKSSDENLPELIKEGAKYVFTYKVSENVSQDKVDEIKNIISTFKLK